VDAAQVDRVPADLPLHGFYQRLNAATALAVVDVLGKIIPVSADHVNRGIASVYWPGRMQRVQRPGGQIMLLDGAHNPAGSAALAEHLATLATPWDLVFGTLADKDAASMAAALAPGASRVWLAPPESPRALSLAALTALPPLNGATPASGAAEALDRSLALRAADRAPLLVVTGSLYLVGEARRWLRERYGVPAPAADLATWSPAG
jgi:dihydrofolate synthase/folylpolyglutamate synthase